MPGEEPPESEDRLNAFLNAWLADRTAGLSRTVEHYQREWPEVAAEIAAEFAAAADEGPGTELGRIGKFRLLGRLGRGGQGVVYLAEDTILTRKVALKVLNYGGPAHPESKARFRREALVTARLDLRGIRTVYEVGEHQGTPWIAMQYVDGRSLGDLLHEANAARAAGTPLPPPLHGPRSVVVLFARIARVLAAAHARGVVHRDIKPGNILVTPEGDPVLLDFGMARAAEFEERTLTRPGEVPGTPEYRAPECHSEPATVDARSDLWAFGVTLHESLFGVRPFQSATDSERCRMIEIGALSIPEDPRPGALRRIRHVLRHLLAPEPTRRYASAEIVAEDLEALLADRPIHARPPGLRERVTLLVRRYRLLAAILASSVLAAVAVATILLVLQWQRDREASIALARSILSRVAARVGTERDPEVVLFDFVRALHLVHGETAPLHDALVVARTLRDRGALRAAELAAEAVLEQGPPDELRAHALEIAAASRLFHSDAPTARRLAKRLPDVPGAAAVRESLATVAAFLEAPVSSPFRVTAGHDSLAVLVIPGRPAEIIHAEHADLDEAIRLRRWQPGTNAAAVVDLKVDVAGTRPVVPLGIRLFRDPVTGIPVLFVTVHRRDHDAGALLRIRVDPATGSFGGAETLAVCDRAPGLEFTMTAAPGSPPWRALVASAGRRELEIVAPNLPSPVRVPLPAGDNDVMAIQALDLDADPEPEFVIAIPGHHRPGLYRLDFEPGAGAPPAVVPIVSGPSVWDVLEFESDFLVSTGFAPPADGVPADAGTPALRFVSRRGALGPILWRLPGGFPRTSSPRKILRARGGSGAIIAEVRTWRERPSSAESGDSANHVVVIPTPPGSLERFRPPASESAANPSLVGDSPPHPIDGWFTDQSSLVDVADFDHDGDDELVTLHEARIRVHGLTAAVRADAPPGPQSVLAERMNAVAETLLASPVRTGFVSSTILDLTRVGQLEVAAEIIERWIPEIVGSRGDLPEWHAALTRDLALVRGARLSAPPSRFDGFLTATTRRELESMAAPGEPGGWFDAMDRDFGLMEGPREIVSDEAGRLGARGVQGPFAKLSARRESWAGDPTANPQPLLVLASRDAVWNGVDAFRLGFKLYLEHCHYSTGFEAALADRSPGSATPGKSLRMFVSHGRDRLLYDRDRKPVNLDAPVSARHVRSETDMVLGAWFDVEIAYLASLRLARLSLRRPGLGLEQPPELLLFCGLPETFGTEARAHHLHFCLTGADLPPHTPDGPPPGVTAYLDDVRFTTYPRR